MFNAITGLNGSGCNPPFLYNIVKAVVCFWLREMRILINIVDEYWYFLAWSVLGPNPNTVSFDLHIQLFILLTYLIFSG